MAEDSASRPLTADSIRSSTSKGQQNGAATVGLDDAHGEDTTDDDDQAVERRLRLKVDLRLCTIAGILCSLNLLDSGVISSASVTSMLSDLDLTGNRYSVSIFIFTIAVSYTHL